MNEQNTSYRLTINLNEDYRDAIHFFGRTKAEAARTLLEDIFRRVNHWLSIAVEEGGS